MSPMISWGSSGAGASAGGLHAADQSKCMLYDFNVRAGHQAGVEGWSQFLCIFVLGVYCKFEQHWSLTNQLGKPREPLHASVRIVSQMCSALIPGCRAWSRVCGPIP